MKLTEDGDCKNWAYHIDDYLLEVETIEQNQEIVERLKKRIKFYETQPAFEYLLKELKEIDGEENASV